MASRFAAQRLIAEGPRLRADAALGRELDLLKDSLDALYLRLPHRDSMTRQIGPAVNGIPGVAGPLQMQMRLHPVPSGNAMSALQFTSSPVLEAGVERLLGTEGINPMMYNVAFGWGRPGGPLGPMLFERLPGQGRQQIDFNYKKGLIDAYQELAQAVAELGGGATTLLNNYPTNHARAVNYMAFGQFGPKSIMGQNAIISPDGQVAPFGMIEPDLGFMSKMGWEFGPLRSRAAASPAAAGAGDGSGGRPLDAFIAQRLEEYEAREAQRRTRAAQAPVYEDRYQPAKPSFEQIMAQTKGAVLDQRDMKILRSHPYLADQKLKVRRSPYLDQSKK